MRHWIASGRRMNGVAERMNRTIISKARYMLSNARMNKRFWTEAANTTCYLVNRSPSISLNKKNPIEGYWRCRQILERLPLGIFGDGFLCKLWRRCNYFGNKDADEPGKDWIGRFTFSFYVSDFSGSLILHHSCSLKMAQHHWIPMESSLSNTVLLPPSHFLGQSLLHCQRWYWKPIHLGLQNAQGKPLLLMQRSQNMPEKFWLWRS